MLIRDLFDGAPWVAEVADLQWQKLLREPLDVYQDPDRTEALLLQAHQLMPERLEVLVALYKMYAYSNQFSKAQQRIHQVLQLSARDAGFAPDWWHLDAGSGPWDPAEGAARWYLYSLKAMGFVLLRQQELGQALAVLYKLQQLDPRDQVGGSVVLELAQRLEEGAEAD
ncbi:MAG: hypothetical protein SV765_04645 [Pseudomonadota bacterium]|nr:hypothetical protein [Pseudomonadales bacterium]MDY6919484.1 hypothetical protein [Pseudomonadota bacterium]